MEYGETELPIVYLHGRAKQTVRQEKQRMRKRLGVFMVWLAILFIASGCTMSEAQRRGTLEYAAAGAMLGGGIGGGVFALDNSDNWPAIPAGIVGGAILGGLYGYLTAPPEAPLPPAPPPPPPAPALAPPPPVLPQKMALRGVHFDFNKAVVRPIDKPVLDEAADALENHPNVKIYVNGYCDAVGTMSYNLKLSRRRAEAVSAYLEDRGIAPSQLIPQGFGKTQFVTTNGTAAGRAQNRRVELAPVDQQ